MLLLVLAQASINLEEAQRAAGALYGGFVACANLGEPFSTLADSFLLKHKKVIERWGSGAPGGLFTFKTPGTAKAAYEYLNKVEVKADVLNFFNRLRLAKVVVDEVPVKGKQALKVEVPAHHYVQTKSSRDFELLKNLAQVFGADWPPPPGQPTQMDPKVPQVLLRLRSWVPMVEQLPGPRLDTSYANQLRLLFRERVRSSFVPYMSLLEAYLKADSLYRLYAQDSPYPEMARAALRDLREEALKMKEFLTVPKHVIEPAKDTLVTGPGGAQVYKRLPEVKGTLWFFLQNYHPQVASATMEVLSALGVSLE